MLLWVCGPFHGPTSSEGFQDVTRRHFWITSLEFWLCGVDHDFWLHPGGQLRPWDHDRIHRCKVCGYWGPSILFCHCPIYYMDWVLKCDFVMLLYEERVDCDSLWERPLSLKCVVTLNCWRRTYALSQNKPAALTFSDHCLLKGSLFISVCAINRTLNREHIKSSRAENMLCKTEALCLILK